MYRITMTGFRAQTATVHRDDVVLPHHTQADPVRLGYCAQAAFPSLVEALIIARIIARQTGGVVETPITG